MITKLFTNFFGSTPTAPSEEKHAKPSKNLFRKIGSLELEQVEQAIRAPKSYSLEEARKLQGRIANLKKACSPHKKLRIRWANLNNQISQRIKKIQSSVITQKPVEEKSSFPFWLPYSGIGLGTLTGLLSRSLPLTEKNSRLEPILGNINEFKQLEIKTGGAWAIPLLIYISQVGIEMSKDAETKAVFQRFLKAAKKPLSLPLAAHLITSFASMLIALQAKHYLPGKFDPSGHMMFKIQIASLTNYLLSEGSKVSSYRLLVAAYLAYVLSDAVLLHNTASFCHTGNEIFAGIGIGIGLSGISALVSKIYKKTPLEVQT